ncbi:MAG: DUF6273 domain-containing protein [Methanobacteriaceae archaeon]|nr:DUF6273 domain-containing protein [Methanobacteriaceae archaeon]
MKFVKTHANCFLADWYSIMKTHSECFQEDNTHPKATGIFAYAQIVFNTCVYAIEHNGEVKVINNDLSYLSNATIGETVSFGNYYIEKEKSPMEWIVIDKNKDIHAMLLLSKYAIDCMKYNLTYNSIDWKKSEVREWLNGPCYDDAFNDDEKDFIRQRDIYNNENPTYKTTSGEDTKDKVFLLSYKEIMKYLDQDSLKCEATEYAIKKGVYVESGNRYCDWWTRTAGDISSNVMYVSNEGEIVMEGDYCTTDDFGIRPAMYIRYE